MLHLVQLDDFTTSSTANNKTQTPLVIHPDWLLSAWSVDRNGHIPLSRPIARCLSATLRNYFSDPTSDLYTLELFLYHIYSLGQALSLIPYNYTLPSSFSPPSTPSTSQTHFKNQKQSTSPNPTLTTSAQLHVWAWSLSARTSKLGVVITCAGCVCVVARVALGVFCARREHSAVEMLMAVEREGDGDREGGGSRCGVDVSVGGKEEEEREIARLRCRVREDRGGDGRARFVVEGRKEGDGRDA